MSYICRKLNQKEKQNLIIEATMTTHISFTKMHGAGNDYIYVDTHRFPIDNPEQRAIEWSAPHTGIGSDGLVLIGPSQKADFSMRIFNADGSEAMMCGNASRCIGKYVYEYGLTRKQVITLETLSGIKTLNLHVSGDTVQAVTVDMGTPTEAVAVDFAGEFPFDSIQLSIGNPHLVTFVENLADIDLPVVGPQLENHRFFPERINVEFAQIIGRNEIRMRVWERGSGITKACGTGACATAAVAALTGRTDRQVDIHMDGGTLTINWDTESGHLLMTGPAEKVFDGVITISN